jgi:uncharacterized protein YndB with AHSA1/START domain
VVAPAPRGNLSLNLSRVFDAPRERVFRAWTEPALLEKWWGPPGFSCPLAQVDLRTGGRYRLGMQPPDGDVFYLGGVFREIRPPERLVYTWQWEGDPGETLVTVEFRDLGARTEVVLTHERFPDAEAVERHTDGWNGCLIRLADLLADPGTR